MISFLRILTMSRTAAVQAEEKCVLCPVCKQSFDTEGKIPILVSKECGDSICRECLEKEFQQIFVFSSVSRKCPVCRKVKIAESDEMRVNIPLLHVCGRISELKASILEEIERKNELRAIIKQLENVKGKVKLADRTYLKPRNWQFEESLEANQECEKIFQAVLEKNEKLKRKAYFLQRRNDPELKNVVVKEFKLAPSAALPPEKIPYSVFTNIIDQIVKLVTVFMISYFILKVVFIIQDALTGKDDVLG